jgi:hypothetical protein
MNTANDSGVTHYQRLDPHQIDVVLGSARAPRPTPAPRRGAGGLWLLALSGIAAAAWWLGGSQAPMVVAASQPEAAVPAPEPQPVAVVNQAVETRVVNQVVFINSSPPARAAVARPVATPEPVAAPAQGLVSAQYLAQFKSGATRPEAPAQHPYQIATVTIREWDGPNRYVAKWRVEDNQINQGSVCFNFMADGIGYRECRRAAQRYFKDQCKDWTRRVEKSRDKDTREARGQYCSVAGTFVP